MTIIKHEMQRVGVLIDAQNLYHSAQNLYGKRVNFTEVLKEAVAGRQLVRSIAYVITSEAGDEKTFFEALEKAGIETKTKDLQIFYGGAKKADWDVGIAVDAIKLAPTLDAIVIASGDGDFIPMIRYVQESHGCQVEVISFKRSTSSNLIAAADDFIDMCAEPKKYLMGSKIARSHNQRKSRDRHGSHNHQDNKHGNHSNGPKESKELLGDFKIGTKTAPSSNDTSRGNSTENMSQAKPQQQNKQPKQQKEVATITRAVTTNSKPATKKEEPAKQVVKKPAAKSKTKTAAKTAKTTKARAKTTKTVAKTKTTTKTTK